MVVLFFSFLISLTYFFLFKFVRAKQGNLVFAALVVFLCGGLFNIPLASQAARFHAYLSTPMVLRARELPS